MNESKGSLLEKVKQSNEELRNKLGLIKPTLADMPRAILWGLIMAIRKCVLYGFSVVSHLIHYTFFTKLTLTNIAILLGTLAIGLDLFPSELLSPFLQTMAPIWPIVIPLWLLVSYFIGRIYDIHNEHKCSYSEAFKITVTETFKLIISPFLLVWSMAQSFYTTVCLGFSYENNSRLVDPLLFNQDQGEKQYPLATWERATFPILTFAEHFQHVMEHPCKQNLYDETSSENAAHTQAPKQLGSSSAPRPDEKRHLGQNNGTTPFSGTATSSSSSLSSAPPAGTSLGNNPATMFGRQGATTPSPNAGQQADLLAQPTNDPQNTYGT